MKCPYCDSPNSYFLKTGQHKCTRCKRKFSPEKILLDQKIIEFFCEEYSANKLSKELSLNYVTIKKRYELFRSLIAKYLEDQYNKFSSSEYDEYIYLPKSKKKVKENIFDSYNFLTFTYNETKVYNLLMPNLHRYKSQFINDGLEEVYFKEFSKFMMFNKIAKTKRKENTITRFWNFFEDSILKYKGVDNENFFFYLKECEFRFNYTKDEAKEILLHLYKSYKFS